MYWAKMAADQGNPEGQWRVGFLYYFGYGVEVDYQEAMRWYRPQIKEILMASGEWENSTTMEMARNSL